MTFTVRPATLADAKSIATNNRQLAFETEGRRLESTITLAAARHVIADPALGRYWLAVEDDVIVGQLLVLREWSDWLNLEYWWISSVFVAAERRRQGVLRHLLAHIRELASAAPVAAIRLYLDKDNNKAYRSYQRLGFKLSEYLILESSVAVAAGDQT